MSADDVLDHYREQGFFGVSRPDRLAVNSVNGDGDTPLHLAIIRQCEREVGALLTGGADANAAGEYGRTPLHYAYTFGGDAEIVAMLLAHGARTDVVDDYDAPPQPLSQPEPNQPLLSWLYADPARRPPG